MSPSYCDPQGPAPPLPSPPGPCSPSAHPPTHTPAYLGTGSLPHTRTQDPEPWITYLDTGSPGPWTWSHSWTLDPGPLPGPWTWSHSWTLDLVTLLDPATFAGPWTLPPLPGPWTLDPAPPTWIPPVSRPVFQYTAPMPRATRQDDTKLRLMSSGWRRAVRPRRALRASTWSRPGGGAR